MPSDLWSFATSCYARAEVEALCLHLQQQGQDVCLLLCALWLEHRMIAADNDRLQQLHAISQPWQGEVVQPLRMLRQAWCTAAANDMALARWREQIKFMEQEAERELLLRLEQLTSTWLPAATASACTWLELLSNDRDTLQKLRVAANTP